MGWERKGRTEGGREGMRLCKEVEKEDTELGESRPWESPSSCLIKMADDSEFYDDNGKLQISRPVKIKTRSSLQTDLILILRRW